MHFFLNAKQSFATAFDKNQGDEGLILNLSKVVRFAFTRNHFHFVGQLDKALQIYGNIAQLHISQLSDHTT